MTSPRTGFTLIELLVAIGIMAVVMGSGAVVFTNFNQRQLTLAASREVQTFLKTAQAYARVRNVPSACGTNPLTGYQVVFSSTQLIMQAVCSGTPEVSTIDRPGVLSSITSLGDEDFIIRFNTLQQGPQVRIGAGAFSAITTTTITSTGPGNVTTLITVNSSGVVSDPVVQSN